MNLGSADFEHALRERIRREPALLPRSRSYRLLDFLIVNLGPYQWFFLTYAIVLVYGEAPLAQNVWRTLAWLSLATVLLRTEFWQLALYKGEELRVFEIVPIASKDVFRWYLWRERKSSLISLAGFFILFGCFATIYDTGVRGWGIAAGAAILLWVFQHSMSLALLSLRPMHGVLFLPAACCVFLIVGGLEENGEPASRGILFIRQVSLLGDYLPNIWPVRTFAAFLPVARSSDAWFLAPTLIVVVAVPLIARHLTLRYRIPFATVESSRQQGPFHSVKQILNSKSSKSGSGQSTTAITALSEQQQEEQVRELLANELSRTHAERSGRGLVNRYVTGCMVAKERALLDYLYQSEPVIKLPLLLVIFTVVFTFSTILSLLFDNPVPSMMAAGYILQFAFIGLRSIDRPAGTKLVITTGQEAPVHVYFPTMTLGDCSSALTKILLVDWGLLAPLLFLFWALSTTASGQWSNLFDKGGDWRDLAMIVATVFYIGVASTPRRIVWVFRPAISNVFQLIPGFAFAIASIFAVVSIERPLWHFAGMLVALAISVGEWLRYRRSYEESRSDLVMPASESRNFLKRSPM